MKNIVSARRMREIENYNFEILKKSPQEIMERAGRQAAEYIFEKYAPASVVCVCGDGNNGGDGFVCAYELAVRGCGVKVLFAGQEENLKQGARFFFERIRHLLTTEAEPCEVAVDAVFGIGLNRAVAGRQLWGVESLNNMRRKGSKIISIDIPSGVNADSGRVMGRAVQADDTVTFLCEKFGHVFLEGAVLSGQIKICDAGLVFPDEFEQNDRVICLEELGHFLPVRNPAGHKGNFGSVGIIGGERGMEGAALLSALAALKAGAGRVTVFAPCEHSFYDGRPPELMCRYYGEFSQCEAALEKMDSVVFGPGAGRDASDKLECLLNTEVPLVLDADALYMLARTDRDYMDKRGAPVIITPHLGEGARLLDCSISEIKNNQADCARELAARYNCVAVLKGASTVISDGESRYMYSGLNHGLATAGSGDVLSGITAAFLAQDDALTAAAAGVLAHGAAGKIAAESRSKRGMTARDIIDGLVQAFLTAEGG